MEELSRTKASRRGYRSHITKTYARINEITSSTEPITRTQRISLSTALEQLQQKQTLLKGLDSKIIEALTDDGELEAEICDTEEYQTALAEKIAYVRDFLHESRATTPPPPPMTSGSTPRTSPSTQALPSPIRPTENTSEADSSRTATLPEGDTHVDADVNPTVVQEQPSDSVIDVSSIKHAHHAHEGCGYSTRLPKLSLPYFSGDPYQNYSV